jgi:hypothetical protein
MANWQATLAARLMLRFGLKDMGGVIADDVRPFVLKV